EKAVELSERALALRREVLGPNHPDTLANMSVLAARYTALGRHADRHRLNEEILALRKAALGPDHPDTLWSMRHLANSYAALGRHEEALRLREQTRARMKANLGLGRTAAAPSRGLAWEMFNAGDYETAATLFE